MIQSIPLNSGLVTQVDAEEVGISACTELINAELDKPGLIYKRNGRGAAVSVATNINHISVWVYSGTAYYVITATDGNIYITASLGTLGSTKYDATGTDVKILNYGTQLRFITGLNDADDAKVYQNIDRHFFWSAYQPAEALTMSTTRPIGFGLESDGMSLYDAGGITFPRTHQTTSTWWLGDGSWEPDNPSDGVAPTFSSGFDYDNDVYYYKLTKVYDGNQESPLPKDVFVNSKHSPIKTVADTNYSGAASTNLYFGFQFKVTEASFDERVTAINVYRSINDSSGPYYKIDSISTLGKDASAKLADTGIQRVADAQVLRCNHTEATGKGYLVTSALGQLGVGESITQTEGSIVLGKVASGGIGSHDGYGAIINIEEVSGGATLGVDQNYWDEPVTFPGGTGLWYSARTDNNLLYSNNFDLGVDDYVGGPHSINAHGTGNGNNFHDFDPVTDVNPLGDTTNDLFGMVHRNRQKLIALGSQTVDNPVSDWLGNTESSIEVLLHRNYMWQDRNADHHCFWIDMRFTDGATHPFGTASNKTKFKYSVNLDGRQYVANVKIYDTGDVSELHPDWVLFSELTQPDVIPITNYISIPDIQGGEITGLARLMGDLVIFQEKGIYRLSVPSANPSTWSLSESEPNLGCPASNSIAEYENGVFFAGRDNIYHLNSNFQATPVTQTIRDTYQAISNLQNTRLHVDPRKERLLCRFGDTVATTYSLDLKSLGTKEVWSKMDNSLSKSAHLFITDENFKTHTVEAGSTSYLCELEPSSQSEAPTFKRTTGWIKMGDLDSSSVVRRLNIRYLSTEAITAKIYIDGDASTVIKTITIPADTSGADWYKCKPSVRCRYFMVELSTTTSTNAVEIRRLEVEFE